MADRIIAVLGATGAQGSGLVRAVLADGSPDFKVRAITRHPDGDKGKVLAAAGAEVVAGDLDDVESLKKAFAGAYGVYGVTNYWEHVDPDRETQQGRNIAAAAKAAGAKHVIWSTLDDTRERVPLSDDRMPTLMGRYKVPHFDAKADANAAFEGLPVTYLYTTFYWDNFIHFGMGPKKGEDGVYAITLPAGDRRVAGIAAGDIGPCAYGIFRKGEPMIGRSVGIAGGHLTGAEMAAGLGRALGVEVRYNAVPPDVYRSFGFPGAEDVGNMFQYYADFEEAFCASRDIALARELHPGLQTFDQWAKANAKDIPLEQPQT